uniref:NADH dehydrogenase subunit 3 n=1 Tax=Tropilaelaps mercedesae TaxID=418985 RepID=UPI0028D6B519|nr:NADH dehydrogenase subunit 3 [Tropilaelaps mercedesae]WMV02017.1 NADH dehydrogenase subunit 3 [Tropilaelaps mercedesae]
MSFFIISIFISLTIFFFSLILKYQNKWNKNKSSLFECGFDSFSLTRNPFSLHFFKLCLVFIIFDIEIIIMLPLPLIITSNLYLFYSFSILFLIIFLSLLFEWNQKTLEWIK